MKKTTLFLFIFCLNLSFAQNFTNHLIDSSNGDALSTKISDLDNDGDFDIIATYYNEPGTPNTGKLIWYENDGSQNYTIHSIDNTINGAIYIAIADVNNDGNKDILLNAYDGNALYLYVSNGGLPLSFLPKFTIDSNAIGSNYSAATDLDGDGILDALSANYSGNELAWYKWDGAISVIKNVIDANIPMISSVETGDLDGDSDADLIVAAGNELYWYENDAVGNFTKHNIAASAGFNGAITAYFFDFDNDSDLDIIGTASSTNEVAWFENDGNQTFTKHTVGTGIAYASYGMASDFNNDGATDIMVSATNSNELLWFENTGTNINFTQHIAASAASVGDAYAIDLKDIDGDGDMDAALTAPGPNKLFWLENDYISIPENDLIANAIPLNCGDVILGNTTDAINEIGEGDCTEVYDDSKDVWYTYTGTGSAEVINLTTCSSNSLYDTAIAVYTGTPGNLSCLVDNDDDFQCGDDLLSTVNFTSDGTSTYYIKVQGYDEFEYGQFELTVGCALADTSDLALYDIQFYPNPVKNNLTIKANEKIQNIAILNILGQQLINKKVLNNTTKLNTETLTKGTYFVKVLIQNKTFSFKIVK